MNQPKPKVVRNADGTCTEFIDVVCEEGETCNPPPPREVPCPPELAGGEPTDPPKPARAKGTISMSYDGECTLYHSVECDPGEKCNPPPPEKVKCPPEELAKLPDAPSSGGRLRRNPTGVCTFFHDSPKCPPGATCNPPPPMAVKCPPEEKPDPKALPEAPSSGGKLERNEDGSCTFYFDDPPCPEGAMCNPPPPMQVQCPAPEKPKVKGTIRMNDNGTCTLFRRSSCPEGARCNPPPPRKIECPPGMTAGESRKVG